MKEFSVCVKNYLLSIFYVLLAVIPNMSWAEDEAVFPATDPMASVGKVVITLAGMIGLILLLAYWAKRLQGMNKSSIGMSASNSQLIKTLATVSLGMKEKVSLIQVGEQQLLIGITAQSIQTLLVLDEPIEQADIEKNTPVFQALLNKALQKA